MEPCKNAQLPEPSIASLSEFPVNETSLHVPLTELPQMETLRLQSTHSLWKSPVKDPPSPRGPYGEKGPFPEPSFTYPSVSPVMEPSLQVPLAELP